MACRRQGRGSQMTLMMIYNQLLGTTNRNCKGLCANMANTSVPPFFHCKTISFFLLLLFVWNKFGRKSHCRREAVTYWHDPHFMTTRRLQVKCLFFTTLGPVGRNGDCREIQTDLAFSWWSLAINTSPSHGSLSAFAEAYKEKGKKETMFWRLILLALLLRQDVYRYTPFFCFLFSLQLNWHFIPTSPRR